MRSVSPGIRMVQFAAGCVLVGFIACVGANRPGSAYAADDNRPQVGSLMGADGSLRPIRPITQISTDIRLENQKLPPDNARQLFGESLPHSRAAMNRSDWPETTSWWVPSEFSHWPLYFDDVPLERYGQTPCRLAQPGLSGAHFFGNVALLPYEMFVDLPLSRISQLGYYRPGSETPALRERLRLALDPAILNTLHR